MNVDSLPLSVSESTKFHTQGQEDTPNTPRT